MDVALYLRVFWRFRYIVLAGIVVAVALAFLAVFKVNPSGPSLSYRQHKLYEADTTLLVTQVGFPWGRTVLPSDPTTTPASQNGIQYADPARFASLAVFYAHVANGDAVQALVKRDPSLRGDFGATKPSELLATASTPDPSTSNGVLPFVDIQGVATSPRESVRISTTGAEILRSYIANQQAAAAIPTNQRVVLSVFKHPDKVVVAVGRKKTLPILIFLTVMMATIGTVLLLENLRPRVRGIEADADPDLAANMRQVA